MRYKEGASTKKGRVIRVDFIKILCCMVLVFACALGISGLVNKDPEKTFYAAICSATVAIIANIFSVLGYS